MAGGGGGGGPAGGAGGGGGAEVGSGGGGGLDRFRFRGITTWCHVTHLESRGVKNAESKAVRISFALRKIELVVTGSIAIPIPGLCAETIDAARAASRRIATPETRVRP